MRTASPPRCRGCSPTRRCAPGAPEAPLRLPLPGSARSTRCSISSHPGSIGWRRGSLRRRRWLAPMRAPDFWDEAPGLVSGLLSPLGAAFDAAGRLRRAMVRPYRALVPVVCVGNLVAGGSGKTPVVLSLAGVLARRGIDAQIVMRGYGGRLAGPVQANPERHDAADVGDE